MWGVPRLQTAAAEELRESYFERMWDVSMFTTSLKQRFTVWYNRKHDRKGTFWEERYKSVLVERNGDALATMAAYIDLNPLRAGMVASPVDYRFCGYAEAVVGDEAARAGLGVIAKYLKATQSIQLAWFWRSTGNGCLGKGPRRAWMTMERPYAEGSVSRLFRRWLQRGSKFRYTLRVVPRLRESAAGCGISSTAAPALVPRLRLSSAASSSWM